MRSVKLNTFKKIIDTLMTIILLCLMAYQVTGEALHEWLGISMTVLVILHNFLNFKWYATLFKGKHNAYRIVTVVFNILLFVSIILTAICGMAISTHTLPFLYGILPISFARRFHLAMSFWSFILMGFHLGLHIPALFSAFKLNVRIKKVIIAIFICISAFGFWYFINSKITDYIFFKTPFAFFDYNKSNLLVFFENFSILIFFASMGTTIAILLKPRKKHLSD